MQVIDRDVQVFGQVCFPQAVTANQIECASATFVRQVELIIIESGQSHPAQPARGTADVRK